MHIMAIEHGHVSNCRFDCVNLLYSCVSEAHTTFCLTSERVQLSCHLANSNYAMRWQSTTQHVSL